MRSSVCRITAVVMIYLNLSAGPATTPAAADNPVYAGYLADPFVWQTGGTYYAVGTGKGEADAHHRPDRVIPMFKSVDLQHWTELGPVLLPPADEAAANFWAPETATDGTTWYLYYASSGGGHGFHVRVASSSSPAGPYTDTSPPLTDTAKTNGFAIDPDVFTDDDGQRYLFYATDFYDTDATTHRGTALAMLHLKSMTETDGQQTVVMRSHWSWQIYQRHRKMGGKVADWYTLEAPEIIKHAGKYYCFYSGGNYQNDTYGVDYLVADTIRGPWREVGQSRGPQIMRSVPGSVIGPGHCSLFKTPDGTDHIAYHAWNKTMTDRQLWIDPVRWTGDVPSVDRFQARITQANAETK